VSAAVTKLVLRVAFLSQSHFCDSQKYAPITITLNKKQSSAQKLKV